MIKIFQINNILDNNRVSFSESKKYLSVEELEKLKHIELLDFKFSKDLYFEDWKTYFLNIFTHLFNDYNVYFYITEKRAKQKSKVRSLKKLLYPYKSKLKSSDVFEDEVLMDEGKTIIYSVIKLSMNNIEFVLDNFLNSSLSFIRIDSSSLNDKDLSISSFIEKATFKKGGLFDYNILKLLAFMISDHSSIINIHIDGSDNYHLRFFFQNRKHADTMKTLSSLLFKTTAVQQ